MKPSQLELQPTATSRTMSHPDIITTFSKTELPSKGYLTHMPFHGL